MSYSSLIVDYLGSGLAADRPASLAISPTTVGIYFATDTNVMSLWNGATSAWYTLTPGSGTVTSIIAGTGLTGGTITSTGTIAVDAASVPMLDGSGYIPFAQMQPEVENSPLVFPIIGKPLGSAILALVPAVQKTIIPANLAGTVLIVNSAADLPTAAASVELSVLSGGSWTAVGTIGISTAGALTLPTFSQITLDPVNGDALRLVNQATADATFGNFAFGIQTKKVAG